MFLEVKNTLISHFMLVLPLKYVSSVAPVHLSCIDTFYLFTAQDAKMNYEEG